MPTVEVELQRRNQSNDVQPWRVNDDGTDPVADEVARDSLAAILLVLEQLQTRISTQLIFLQSNPASVWTIDHNLGGFPNVTVLDSSNQVIEGDVTYPTPNQIVITFNGAFSGRAFLS